MNQEITAEIITKASEGDLDAFRVIYDATAGFVYNVARRVVHNTQDAEEITQEVFLVIHSKLKYFRLESSFKTWAYRIAVNHAINHYKKMARERDKKKEYQGYSNQWQAAAGAEMENEEHKETIDSFLNALNADQKICVVLRNIEGLSYRQIADTLKINVNTVRSRLKRAREKLLVMRKEVAKNEL